MLPDGFLIFNLVRNFWNPFCHQCGLNNINKGQTRALHIIFVRMLLPDTYKEIIKNCVYNLCGFFSFGTQTVKFPQPKKPISRFQGKIIKLQITVELSSFLLQGASDGISYTATNCIVQVGPLSCGWFASPHS